MTDQIEVQEKVRWEDLEVVEEPRYFEGLGEEAAQIHQELCGGITEWEEGNEPVPIEYKQGVDYAKPGSESNGFIFGAAVMRGIVLAFGISVEEFTEAMEGRARAALEMEMDYLDTPVLGAVDWREANKRLPRISEMVARVNAFCTPSRNPLTDRPE